MSPETPAAPAAAAPATPGATPPPAAPAVAAPAAPPPAVPAATAPAAAAPPAPAAQPAAPAAPVEPAKPASPPAPVEIALKLPEGSAYDPKAIGEFKAIFADEKLSPAARAQAVLDLNERYAKEQLKGAQKQLDDMKTRDIETLKADKDFGGTKYEATVNAAKSSAAQFFGEEGVKILKATGLDNHPAIVKGLARLRAAIREDTTNTPNNNPVPPAKVPPQTGTQKLSGMFDRIQNQKKK